MQTLTLLQQIVARWKAKSPNFFKVITIISTIVAVITGIPELLTMFNIVLPSPIDVFASKTVAIAALVGAIISNLTVDTPQTKQILAKINKEDTKK